jgi:hypothetical protein
MKGKLLYKRTADALQILVRLAGKDAQRSSSHVVVDKGLPACNGGLDRADRVAENTWLVCLRAAACTVHRMRKLLWY